MQRFCVDATHERGMALLLGVASSLALMLFEMIVLCPKLPTVGLDLFMFNTPFTLSSLFLCYFYLLGSYVGAYQICIHMLV